VPESYLEEEHCHSDVSAIDNRVPVETAEVAQSSSDKYDDDHWEKEKKRKAYKTD
jgi:hypothetical protein